MSKYQRQQLSRAEKAVDRCLRAYQKTRSHVWLARLRDARTKALSLAGRR